MTEDTGDHSVYQCLPISKLEDVWVWENEHARKWPSMPLQPSTDHCYQGTATSCHVSCEKWKLSPRLDRNTSPKTLLCHDMKGGYIGDRFVNGTKNCDEYRFYHWAGIDIFVYFSHHLVTIPPLMWINAAHLHGVKILGTFITEWESGQEICKEILKNHDNIEKFVKKLVDIADHYGFDGWLLNIENKVCEEVGNVQDLVLFVDLLKNEMHRANPDSLIIWYDSVTSTNGQLKWQNELNSNNSTFFDHSDGIFLNYSWKEENIKTSQLNSQDRPHDVYVGIDVFGRNFYEGGGFNTHKALEVARKYGLSIAIFAPGWVHENHCPKDFTLLEYYFWNTLRPHLFLHGPNKLPFQTSFCQGAGLKKYHLGKVISSIPWFNLTLQQYQPSTGSCRHLHFEANCVKTSLLEPGCMETSMSDAFNGGNSLMLSKPHSSGTASKNVMSSKNYVIHRIFICGFFCDLPFLVSVASKNLNENAEFGIILKLKSLKGKHRYQFFLLYYLQTKFHYTPRGKRKRP
ncbi:cytosolic endo-beta-N-acetylglucosaminidase isoform X2 [Hetaerina americana]|uniref:cytosolic endo-beta-N-acetylglucosaminidase isoform X2 n=1 Tax=Hetaerina americana TaxID=62018 RepID=UPI003A7F4CF7